MLTLWPDATAARRLRQGVLAVTLATAVLGAGPVPALAADPPAAAAEPTAPQPPAVADPGSSGSDATQGSEAEAQPAPPAGCPVRAPRKLELIV